MSNNFLIFDIQATFGELFLVLSILFIISFFLVIINSNFYNYPTLVVELNYLVLFILFITADNLDYIFCY